MKITGDYHTHTKASDGHTTTDENIQYAKRAELSEFAITDHGYTIIIFHITDKKYAEQQKTIDEFKKLTDLKILHGIEANIYADGTLDVCEEKVKQLQILNVGFHRLLQFHTWKNTPKFIHGNGWMPLKYREKLRDDNTKAYIKAIETYPIDTICHLNHRCLVNTKMVCDCAKAHDVYIELNEKHLDTLEPDIQDVIESGVNLILGSDAHRKDKIGKFDKTLKFIEKYNIPQNRIYGLNGLNPIFKDKSNWKRK